MYLHYLIFVLSSLVQIQHGLLGAQRMQPITQQPSDTDRQLYGYFTRGIANQREGTQPRYNQQTSSYPYRNYQSSNYNGNNVNSRAWPMQNGLMSPGLASGPGAGIQSNPTDLFQPGQIFIPMGQGNGIRSNPADLLQHGGMFIPVEILIRKTDGSGVSPLIDYNTGTTFLRSWVLQNPQGNNVIGGSHNHMTAVQPMPAAEANKHDLNMHPASLLMRKYKKKMVSQFADGLREMFDKK